MSPWLAAFLGLLALTVGADLLVRGSVALGRRASLSSLFLGLTVVAFGTSSPELFASLASASRGQSDLAVGNVVGSNLFNIAVILGLTACVRPVPVSWPGVRGDVLLALVASACPLLALATGGVLVRPIGGALLAVLLTYLVVRLRASRTREPRPAPGSAQGGAGALASAAMVGAGLALLAVGADQLVDGSVRIAHGYGISELAIGLTIVAAGTSAPELFTSIVAAVRGEVEVAIGNVVGSNCFNVFGILGLTCLYRPQEVADPVLARDTPLLFLASLALLPILSSGSRISRLEGAALLAGYAGYLVLLLA